MRFSSHKGLEKADSAISFMEGALKHTFGFLLGATLLIAPQFTQAQAAEPATARSKAEAPSKVHVSSDWAKARLAEMEATLASLEKKLGDVKSESRAKAERAVADMRVQRDALKQTIEAKRDASEADWQKAKANIQSHWIAFEADVQTWVGATGERVAEHKDIFVARAEAQLKAWQDKIHQLEASAKDFASSQKGEVDSAVAALRADAEATKAKLETIKQSGKQSWAAFSKALDESRAAFDRATQTASDAFKHANG